MELTDDDASEERTVASEELRDFFALINKRGRNAGVWWPPRTKRASWPGALVASIVVLVLFRSCRPLRLLCHTNNHCLLDKACLLTKFDNSRRSISN